MLIAASRYPCYLLSADRIVAILVFDFCPRRRPLFALSVQHSPRTAVLFGTSEMSYNRVPLRALVCRFYTNLVLQNIASKPSNKTLFLGFASNSITMLMAMISTSLVRISGRGKRDAVVKTGNLPVQSFGYNFGVSFRRESLPYRSTYIQSHKCSTFSTEIFSCS